MRVDLNVDVDVDVNANVDADVNVNANVDADVNAHVGVSVGADVEFKMNTETHWGKGGDTGNQWGIEWSSTKPKPARA